MASIFNTTTSEPPLFRNGARCVQSKTVFLVGSRRYCNNSAMGDFEVCRRGGTHRLTNQRKSVNIWGFLPKKNR